MVKTKVKFTTSDQVTKDLLGKRGKKKQKKKLAVPNVNPENLAQNVVILPETRMSDEAPVKKRLWKNKQRVLVFGTRGIPFRGRHFMDDLRRLLPHTKKESKMDKRDTLFSINEIAEMKNCNKCLFFEGRKTDIYLWAANIGSGPSAKFLVENMATMEELKFTGNCLKGSRAILSFDPTFDSLPHFQLLKELFMQIFGTPYHYPKSQPFIDHVFTFTVLDDRIWFRNFQIMEEDGSLVEIGPRFALNPIRIFDGSFHGETLYSNPNYVSPNKYRSLLKKSSAGKYQNRVYQKELTKETKPKSSMQIDPRTDIFGIEPSELE